jgi:hypothetical protein
MREEGRVSSLKRAKSPSATGLRHAKNELRKFVTSASVFFLRSARGVVLVPGSDKDNNGGSGNGGGNRDGKVESTTSISDGGRRRR